MEMFAVMYAAFLIWVWRDGISNIIAIGVERGIRRSKDEAHD